MTPGQELACPGQCESGDGWEMPPSTTQEHKDKDKGPGSHVPGKEEAPQGQGLRGRELLSQMPTTAGVGNAFIGDSLAPLSLETNVMMGW